MHLTLVVPGPLDLPASVLGASDARASAFSRLLAAAGSPTIIDHDGLLASRCRLLGIAKQSDWPIAPWLARAAGFDPEDAYWLCAAPATLIVGQDDVRLSGLVDDLALEDAEALLAVLNAHFADDAVRFFAPTARQWFVRVLNAQRLETRPPEVALGAPLFAFMPAGADAARWRRWQNEMQMLLFEHPANREREQASRAPVNSIWLWGGGTVNRERGAPAASIFADDVRMRDLARGRGVEVAPAPANFDALPLSGTAAVWLMPIDHGDAIERLGGIDRTWMAPVERALNAGRLSEVELIVGGRERALHFAVRRSSFARRWRARLSPPRLSHLLAASFIDTGVAPEMAIDPFGRA